jgi:hypothetical protein
LLGAWLWQQKQGTGATTVQAQRRGIVRALGLRVQMGLLSFCSLQSHTSS